MLSSKYKSKKRSFHVYSFYKGLLSGITVKEGYIKTVYEMLLETDKKQLEIGAVGYEVEEPEDDGLDEPVVEEIFGSGNPDRTILTLSLTSPRPSLGTQGTEVSTEVTTQVKLKPEMLMRLLYFCETPRTRQEMQDFCGIKTEKYFREKIVRPMLAEKMIVRTIPDKPNSKNQKYVAKR